jgi:hypothetical protein
LFVERVAVEILVGEFLIDDGDGNGGGVICTGKCAALEQAGACGREIFRTDADDAGIRALSHRQRRSVTEGETPPLVDVFKRKRAADGHGIYAGKRFEPRQQLLRKSFRLFRLLGNCAALSQSSIDADQTRCRFEAHAQSCESTGPRR